jgi:hypothetical protein
METDGLTTAYTEVQVDEDSISFTLLSESHDGVTVEDTERFTFAELEDMAGQHLNLSLSADSQSALGEQQRLAAIGLLHDSQQSDFPQEGDILTDRNAPRRSSHPRTCGFDSVEVVDVLPNIRADEYVIDGKNENRVIEKSLQSLQSIEDITVADVNPSYDADEAVVKAQYEMGGDKVYAFPISRLTETEEFK